MGATSKEKSRPARPGAARPAKGAPERAGRTRTRLSVEDRRAQLVALGIARFSGRPYDEVSIDEIADAAGISKGLLYHYFPTKRDFYVAAITQAASELLERTAPDRALPPLERAARGIDGYLAYVEEHALAFVALMTGAGQDPQIVAVIERTRQVILERILEGIEAEVTARAPARPPAFDTPAFRIAMRGFIGFAEAASLDWLRTRDLTRAEISALLVRVFLGLLQSFLGP